MLDTGRRNAFPAKYRLLLALSVALTLHTLVVAFLPFINLPDDRPDQGVIKISLAQPGSRESLPTPPPTEAVPHRPAALPAPTPSTLAVPSRPASQRVADPEPPAPAPTKPPQTAPMSTSTPAPADKAAQDEPIETATEQLDVVTQLSEPAPTSPYLTALAVRIAEHARSQFAHALAATLARRQPAPVQIELMLMNNGALIGASVVRSSGNPIIDRAAYQGALSASPYPAPPEGNKEGNRFRVEIVFSPERL
ncbi:energy transducer TonB family protein [Marinobacter sp. SS21]|uniref:energy transducer TonB family protein n=1 Tax=Marinobacter sp. SS21 TaxID=2979460 RepID=UPI00232FAB80|nr:energy transducer TonB [Marinobacter sp. SS21]MDC0662599.1 TonB family protein [Marinobacter sp. SS21]